MTKQNKDYVVTYEWWQDDGWYGQTYRIVLSKTKGVGFTTKTEANKYKKLVRDYAKIRSNNIKVLRKNCDCDERHKYKTYIYCNLGPGYSCKNIDVDIESIKLLIERGY